MKSPIVMSGAALVPARLALASIASFWAVWLVLVTGRALVMDWPDQGGMLVRRLGMAAVGAALAWVIHLLLMRCACQRLALRATAAFTACIPAALLFAVLNSFVFYRWFPVPSVLPDLARWDEGAVLRTAVADGFVTWYFFFAAWAAFLLALGVVGEVRMAERARGEAEAAARDARLAMLRLQVDPHFLFNALNALSSMVACGETKAAGAMIRDLAAFFRTGLVEDPAADVNLAEEVEFQRLYLAIEQARFGERLRVSVDVTAKLNGVKLPALLLQPLVENAVKHGLGGTTAPVLIKVRAWQDGAMLHLNVTDCSHGQLAMPDARQPSTGIGLANVRARLAARFGPTAALTAGPIKDGWSSTITVPLEPEAGRG
ncbi:MAG: sensor histidine kinase [Stutzerimonas stutzeri]|nr:MAG: sensor histidine kinase [Stutzerimonas stutzeri]